MNGFSELKAFNDQKTNITSISLSDVLGFAFAVVLFCRLSVEFSCRVYSLQILWKLKKKKDHSRGELKL